MCTHSGTPDIFTGEGGGGHVHSFRNTYIHWGGGRDIFTVLC